MSDEKKKVSPRDLAQNRQASHDYYLDERYEAGIELLGSEVKSVRAGNAALREAYVQVRDGQAWLVNCHVPPWPFAGNENPDPRRSRRLLLHRSELRKIEAKLRTKGLTIVPTRLYAKGRRIKCEVALARGKKLWDKRETERRRTVERETRAAVRERSGR